jgi:hypothetical protein
VYPKIFSFLRIKLQDLKFRKEYFPFLLPLFYIIHYYFVNFPFFPIKLAISLFLQYLLAVVFLNFLFLPFLKTWRKSSLFTFSILCLQFFFIFLYEFLSEKLGGTIFSKDLFILTVLVLAWVWLFLRLKKNSGSLSRLVKFFNVLMVSWILVELFIFIGFKNYLNTELKKTVTIKECSNCEKPDIYLLILDEYAGQKTLIDKFQFDNSEFLSYLRSRNFHIVPGSKSNYNLTLFSVASMLSLDKLRISNYKKPSTKDFILAGLKLNQSPVGKYFQRNGYEIYNLSLFSFLNLPSHFKHSYVRNFVEELKSRTLTGHIQHLYQQMFVFNSKKNEKGDSVSLDFNYNNALINFFLQDSFRSNKPKFVYAHFLMPHFPHLLNEKGQFNDLKSQYSQDTYLGYLKYCNLRIMPVIDKILSSSITPPIILLMSDHGFRGFAKPADPKYYFMNLNAIYLPDQNYDAWYDSVSNVNQFRILLNQEFNQNLPLLKDTTIRLMGSHF